MHIEVQVALNFVISYLYNKLPRRRVNIFGEELEKALKEKFRGHWYPEMPSKGSAFRCLKTGDPVDGVFEKAARESGVPIQDVLENLPNDLAVWVDPGEVSYRIGEKGSIKVLYSEVVEPSEEASAADKEVIKTFNPEAQCFRPIEAVRTSLGGLSLSPPGKPPASPPSSDSSPPAFKPPNCSPSPVAPPAFLHRSTAPLTFTTATFAQTKFGSTKPKTNCKRPNRMEFFNNIKQKVMQQQQQQQAAAAAAAAAAVSVGLSPGRSLSPGHPEYGSMFGGSGSGGGGGGQGYYRGGGPSSLYPPSAHHHHQVHQQHPSSMADLFPKFPYLDPSPGSSSASSTSSSSYFPQAQPPHQGNPGSSNSQPDPKDFPPYSPGQYQHLLVAN